MHTHINYRRTVHLRLPQSDTQAPATVCCSVLQRNMYPLTEEIRLEIFGSPDLSGFRSVGFPDRSFEWRGLHLHTWNFCMKIWGLPWKRVWYVRGLLWKLVEIFGSRNYLMSDFLRPWIPICSHLQITSVLCIYVSLSLTRKLLQ